jgi:hypothetical protein
VNLRYCNIDIAILLLLLLLLACVLTTLFCTFCAKLHEARTQQRLLPLLVSMNRIMGGFLARGGTSEQTVQNLMEKQLAREAAAAVTARAERIGRTAGKAPLVHPQDVC